MHSPVGHILSFSNVTTGDCQIKTMHVNNKLAACMHGIDMHAGSHIQQLYR